MSEVSKAKKEILATMDITEEEHFPLPAKYFSLLHKKSREGVKIERVIFGSVKEYKIFLNIIKAKNLFFIGKRTNSKNYKRMIMIDGQKLFLKNKNKFYFTTDYRYIKEYKIYFCRFK